MEFFDACVGFVNSDQNTDDIRIIQDECEVKKVNFTIGEDKQPFSLSMQEEGTALLESKARWFFEAVSQIMDLPETNLVPRALAIVTREYRRSESDVTEATVVDDDDDDEDIDVDTDDGDSEVDLTFVGEEDEQSKKRMKFDCDVDKLGTTFSNFGDLSRPAVRTLLSELHTVRQSSAELGFTADPINDNLAQWAVEVKQIPNEQLTASLKELGMDSIVLHFVFPPDFPNGPPYVRVIRPRFVEQTGHVMRGGAICMELLSSQHWSAVYRLEQIMVQILATMMAGGAQIDVERTKKNGDYSPHEARDSFRGLMRFHNWTHWALNDPKQSKKA